VAIDGESHCSGARTVQCHPRECGFISAGAAELLYRSFPELPWWCGARTAQHDCSCQGIYKVLPCRALGVEKHPEYLSSGCRGITNCLCFSLVSLGHGSQLTDTHVGKTVIMLAEQMEKL